MEIQKVIELAESCLEQTDYKDRDYVFEGFERIHQISVTFRIKETNGIVKDVTVVVNEETEEVIAVNSFSNRLVSES